MCLNSNYIIHLQIYTIQIRDRVIAVMNQLIDNVEGFYDGVLA